MGELRVTRKQALSLGVQPSRQLSPYLEKCCLRVSANNSYRNSTEEIAILTGIEVSAKTQQRLVQRQDFSPASLEDKTAVSQLSLDGGNIRLVTPKGQPSQWRQYKALRVNDKGIGVAFYQANSQLCEWVQTLTPAEWIYCLGDGHGGIWNLYAQMQLGSNHEEILDWFHLKENLYKVGACLKHLHQAESLLWQGKVDQTLALLEPLQKSHARQFCDYLRTHRKRIPHYAHYQAQGIPIGSGTIESWVKQIDRRTQISGAQWREANIPQVLAHRCAYLNGQLDPISLPIK